METSRPQQQQEQADREEATFLRQHNYQAAPVVTKHLIKELRTLNKVRGSRSTCSQAAHLRSSALTLFCWARPSGQMCLCACVGTHPHQAASIDKDPPPLTSA